MWNEFCGREDCITHKPGTFQGTRNKEEELLPFHNGAATFAIRTKSPVVPFGISGEYRLGSGITLRFGEAIQFAGCKADEATECIRSKVMELKKR